MIAPVRVTPGPARFFGGMKIFFEEIEVTGIG
jgi:hypothetical protein